MPAPSKKAAYTVVDISKYSRHAQDLIKADAIGGGPTYGLIMVEFAISGGSQEPIFGYYDGEAWAAAEKELSGDVVAAEKEDDLPPVDHSEAARRRPTK